jgi:hypothetical protein
LSGNGFRQHLDELSDAVGGRGADAGIGVGEPGEQGAPVLVGEVLGEHGHRGVPHAGVRIGQIRREILDAGDSSASTAAIRGDGGSAGTVSRTRDRSVAGA